MDIKNTIFVNQAFASAQRKAESYRHEFIMPEHLLSAILEQEPFINTLQDTFYNYVELSISLENYLTEEVETIPDNVEYELGLSVQLSSLLQHAYMVTEYSSAEELGVPHLIQGLLQLEDSWACHFLKEAVGGDLPEFLSLLITHYEEAELAEEAGGTPSPDEQEKTEPWRNYVTCLNDHLADHNPLIGREMELERTIQVLCRKEKNNPLHVGEPGVGKTALAYGLAARIEAGNVPERLAGFRIYELDLGSLLAGTQYRGDFEKRLKSIMEGIGREGNAIVYIDEIHNLIGAGRTGEGSMDASNMLKPYLETGAIRFIGSTTYDEYNRYFARSKGLVRRFQQIDILEPSIEEAIHIVEGLKEKYETYHASPTSRRHPLRRKGKRPLHQRPFPARQSHRPGGRSRSLPGNTPHRLRGTDRGQGTDNRHTGTYLQSQCPRHERGRHHRLGKPARTHQLPHLRAGRSRPSGGGSCANVQSRTAGRKQTAGKPALCRPHRSRKDRSCQSARRRAGHRPATF